MSFDSNPGGGGSAYATSLDIIDTLAPSGLLFDRKGFTLFDRVNLSLCDFLLDHADSAICFLIGLGCLTDYQV